ncbi:hypothetical protein [Allorhodopirellula solitaria]|uniref:Uncharacterized protein n=1 Tax=Allorhodopirellula solitaria TaxID=2527987 RepID=A0A5C5XWT2_9BACT|nr:hypothetical protein [Allorhodopirellula solitaria]TWT67410.1 hypothetical protein CA85_22600 [Allorhodopirellula solitaria]
MSHIRILRFEVMEPRIALSANPFELLAQLQADIAANKFDPRQAEEILEQIVQSREDSLVSLPPVPSLNSLGDSQNTGGQIDIRDVQGQHAVVVQAGVEYLADPQTNTAADELDAHRDREMPERIPPFRANFPAKRPTVPPTMELNDTPIVRFRVDIRDLQGRPVDAVEAGGTYLAKVFVQDLRDPKAVNPADNGKGGLYQAWVDLEFSENLHPTGSVRVNETFSSWEFDPKIDGSCLRNLGGVASSGTAFGGAEQFLLEAPFVVDSTDAPSRIQVAPSTLQHDPVLLFGSGDAVPVQSIHSPTFDLPSPTNDDPSDNTSTPVINPSNDSATDPPPPAPPATVVSNSGDASHEASGENSFTLVSYIPSFRDDYPDSHSKWRDEDDWWGPERREDGESYSDHWSELDGPNEDTNPVNQADSLSTNDSESEKEETENERRKRQSKHAGLFYDDALFLEGALVETFQSRFRLHLQVISPQRHANGGTAESIANEHATPQRDGFIDIAEILTPNHSAKPWQDNVDEAIASNEETSSPEHHRPAIDWGAIVPSTENAAPHHERKQAEADQKLPDQRTPFAMNQSVENSPGTGLPPTDR